MISYISRQRLFASLLIVGASILLFRTIISLFQNALDVLVLFVVVFLFAEMLIDAGCILSSIRWWITNNKTNDHIPLKFGAAAAVLHAVRVLTFVLGRVGPWIDFDVKPEQRLLHSTRWSWGEVYFAAAMSIIGVIGVLIIWMLRRRAKKVLIINDQKSRHLERKSLLDNKT